MVIAASACRGPEPEVRRAWRLTSLRLVRQVRRDDERIRSLQLHENPGRSQLRSVSPAAKLIMTPCSDASRRFARCAAPSAARTRPTRGVRLAIAAGDLL